MKLKEKIRVQRKQISDLKMARNSARRHGNSSNEAVLSTATNATGKINRGKALASARMASASQRASKLITVTDDDDDDDDDDEWLPGLEDEPPSTAKKPKRRRKTKVGKSGITVNMMFPHER